MADHSTQGKPKQATPPASVWLLRGIHWAKEKALQGCLFGGGCMAAGLLLYPFSEYEGMVVMAVGAGAAVLSFCLLPLLLVLWFPLVFVCHTRYSLRAMLLTFLSVGFAVSLLVMDNPVARLVGGLLVLGAFGTLIAQTLGEFDPVGRAPAPAKDRAGP